MSLDAALPLVLVGAGKMGGAMLAGWLDCGLDASGVTVVDPAPPAEMASLIETLGIRHVTSPDGLASPAVLVLAVKPQMMAAVLPTIAPIVGPETVVVSVAAGTQLATLHGALGPAPAIIRAMPNTPAQVGRGMTVGCAGPEVTPAQRDIVTRLLEAVGDVAWIADESDMDAVTAVSGSGPAYVFLLAECLAAAGEAAGLSPELATQLARTTVAGAGELLARSHETSETLRRNVTSPGGTTAAALAVLMAEAGVPDLMRRAVAAAADRSRELAN
ncbi:MAG: pyrroline-5-carboxylate reductase [Hyphomicrobiales bacterium]